MSHHDCRLSGTIHVFAGLTTTDLHAMLVSALANMDLRSGEQDSFELDRGVLRVSLDVVATGGGYVNPEIDAFIDTLNRISSAPAWLRFVDYDTGSEDDHTTPYFIGPTEDDRKAARVLYGLDQAKTWLEPVLGPRAVSEITELARSFPFVETGTESETAAPPRC